MIIELSKNEKLQNYRIILSQYTSCLHKWLVYFLVCLLLLRFFSGKFLNVCKPRITYPLWQPGPPELPFYGNGLACLPNWLGMVNAGWPCSMRSEIFLQNFPPFYLGSLLHIISSLSSHFRSWSYPGNFGIYSQLDRKSKTWFFTFLCVYVCWIKRDKILISQLSPPKFRYFADQNGRTKVGPHENEFWQFSNTKMEITNRAQKVDEKMTSFV